MKKLPSTFFPVITRSMIELKRRCVIIFKETLTSYKQSHIMATSIQNAIIESNSIIAFGIESYYFCDKR